MGRGIASADAGAVLNRSGGPKPTAQPGQSPRENNMAERKGKKLAVLADGHPRRLADGRNAWRKMNNEQRAEFVRFMVENHHSERGQLGYTGGTGHDTTVEGSGLRVWFGWSSLEGGA